MGIPHQNEILIRAAILTAVFTKVDYKIYVFKPKYLYSIVNKKFYKGRRRKEERGREKK